MGGGKATRAAGMLAPHAWCSEPESGDDEQAFDDEMSAAGDYVISSEDDDDL